RRTVVRWIVPAYGFGVIYLLADLDIISAPEGLESCESLNGLTMERHQRKPQRFLPENPADRLRPLRTPEGRAAVDRTGPLPVGEGTVHARPSRAHPNLYPSLSPDRPLEIRCLRKAAPLSAGEGPQSAQKLSRRPADEEDPAVVGHEGENDRNRAQGSGSR